jgi:dGTPase
VQTVQDVRQQDLPLVATGAQAKEEIVELKRFLRENLYGHERVKAVMAHATGIVEQLFNAFMSDPQRLPAQYQEKLTTSPYADGEVGRARLVADYIAGMTDRYALVEHDRLFGSPISPADSSI